jgi:hypothetical protein
VDEATGWEGEKVYFPELQPRDTIIRQKNNKFQIDK